MYKLYIKITVIFIIYNSEAHSSRSIPYFSEYLPYDSTVPFFLIKLPSVLCTACNLFFMLYGRVLKYK